MRSLPAMAAAVILVAGCSATPATRVATPTPTPPATSSTTVTSDANSASSRVDGVTVTASMPDGAAPGGEKLTVGAASTEIPAAKAQVAGAKTVRVRLGDDGAQPAKPITLSFDLSDKPDLAAAFSDTVIPVVESVSESDSTDTDLFRGRWDAASKSVTVETDHLSDFRLGAIDLSKVAEGIANGYRALRGDTTSPCRDTSAVTIAGVNYTLTATSPGAVAGCLRNINGAVGIDFTNATQQFYKVTSKPSGTWSTTDRPTLSSLSSALLGTAVGRKATNYLSGKGTGTLSYGNGVRQAEIALDLDPVALQAATLITGLEMYTGMRGANGGLAAPAPLEYGTLITTVWGCLDQGLTFADAAGGKAIPREEYRASAATTGGCISAAREGLADSPEKQHRASVFGTVMTLIGDLPDQLVGQITGAIEQAFGDHTLNFALTSTAPSATTSAPAQATAIDRVQVDTWAYDKVGPDTYKIPRGGPATVYFHWKAFSGDDETDADCDSTITVTGGGTTKTKTTSTCGSYNPGTYFELRNRGTYTATITIVEKGGGTTVVTKTVTLQ